MSADNTSNELNHESFSDIVKKFKNIKFFKSNFESNYLNFDLSTLKLIDLNNLNNLHDSSKSSNNFNFNQFKIEDDQLLSESQLLDQLNQYPKTIEGDILVQKDNEFTTDLFQKYFQPVDFQSRKEICVCMGVVMMIDVGPQIGQFLNFDLNESLVLATSTSHLPSISSENSEYSDPMIF